MEFAKLFESGVIGDLTLKNRIFFPAMSSWLAGVNGEPTEDLIAHYERIARGGAGLVVVETVMLPPLDENLIALSKRFVKTLRSCVGSP